jgi:hypothetical protein
MDGSLLICAHYDVCLDVLKKGWESFGLQIDIGTIGRMVEAIRKVGLGDKIKACCIFGYL